MKFLRSDWLLGALQLAFVIFVLAVSFMIVLALGKVQDSREPLTADITKEKAISVSVMMPRLETFTPSLNLNGVVNSQAQIQIAAQVGGRVLDIAPNFKPGGEITAGSELFRIDPADYVLAVEAAEAEIAAAKSSLAQTEAEAALAIEEWNELYPGENIPDLAARRPQIEAAKARLQGAIASKKASELSLSRTKVLAEDNLRIVSTQLSVGQLIAPNQAVGMAYPLNSIEISVPLSLEELSVITPVIGREATITPTNGDAFRVMGRVVRQDAALDSTTRLSGLFIKPEKIASLSVGEFVRVSVQGDAIEDAMMIPKTAFSERGTVWVVVNGRLAPRHVVEIGESDAYTYVRRFHAGDGVVIVPPGNLFEGMNVAMRGDKD